MWKRGGQLTSNYLFFGKRDRYRYLRVSTYKYITEGDSQLDLAAGQEKIFLATGQLLDFY